MICKICLVEHDEEARMTLHLHKPEADGELHSLIVAYVKAKRERETYVQNHTGETMKGVDLLLAEDAAWAALVAEADRG